MADKIEVEFVPKFNFSKMKQGVSGLANEFVNKTGDYLSKLAIGKSGSVGGTSGGGISKDAISAGVAGGIVAAGIFELLKIVVDVLMAFPPIMAIFKLLKMIIMLLLLPLVPLLKPVLLLLGGMAKAIAPLLKMISANIEKILGPTIDKLITEISTFVAENAQKVAEVLGTLFDILVMIPVRLVSKNIDSIVNVLKFFSNNSDKFFKIIVDVLKWAENNMDSLWKVIASVLDTASKVMEPLWNTLRDILNWAATNLDTVWKIIKGVLDDAKTMLADKFATLRDKFNDMVDWINKIIDKIKGAVNSIGSLVGKIGIKIPKMASGGIVTSPTIAMVGEAGPEAVIPLKGNKGVGGSQNITINMNNPVIREERDIKKLVKEIQMVLYKEQRRFNSYV